MKIRKDFRDREVWCFCQKWKTRPGDILKHLKEYHPLRIMAALRDFVKTRGEDIDRIERERHSAALALDMTEREGGAISYEEYKKIKAREKTGGKKPEKYPEMPQD